MREAGFGADRDPPRPGRDRAGRARARAMSAVTELVSIERDGAEAARAALERRSPPAASPSSPPTASTGSPATRSTPAAIARIHELKGRDDGKPSAVMYFSPLAMRELVAGLGPRTAAAVSALLPGPVTLVVANPGHRYPLACREDPERLGVRLIAGPLAGAMCPIFQTSANLSGEPAPARFDDGPGGDRRRGRPGDRRRRADRAALDRRRHHRDRGGRRLGGAARGRALARRPRQRPRRGRPRLAGRAQQPRRRGRAGGPGAASCCRPRSTRRAGRAGRPSSRRRSSRAGRRRRSTACRSRRGRCPTSRPRCRA